MTKVKTLNSDCGGGGGGGGQVVAVDTTLLFICGGGGGGGDGGGGAAVEAFPLKSFDALFGVIEVVWLPSTVGVVAVVLLAEIFRGGGVAPFCVVNSEVVDDVDRTEIVVTEPFCCCCSCCCWCCAARSPFSMSTFACSSTFMPVRSSFISFAYFCSFSLKSRFSVEIVVSLFVR